MSEAAGAIMIKVTGLPSGQRVVWPLQTLANSGRVSSWMALDRLEITARSRAVAVAETSRMKPRMMMFFRASTPVSGCNSLPAEVIPQRSQSNIERPDGDLRSQPSPPLTAAAHDVVLPGVLLYNPNRPDNIQR